MNQYEKSCQECSLSFSSDKKKMLYCEPLNKIICSDCYLDDKYFGFFSGKPKTVDSLLSDYKEIAKINISSQKDSIDFKKISEQNSIILKSANDELTSYSNYALQFSNEFLEKIGKLRCLMEEIQKLSPKYTSLVSNLIDFETKRVKEGINKNIDNGKFYFITF
jgi:hypothetical protein